MALLNLLMQECEVDRKIAFRFTWTRGLQLVEQTWGASQAFVQLYRELCRAGDERISVSVQIRGVRGQDVERVFSSSSLPSAFLKSLFRAWYTQAVQAHAAILRQPVVLPSEIA